MDNYYLLSVLYILGSLQLSPLVLIGILQPVMKRRGNQGLQKCVKESRDLYADLCDAKARAFSKHVALEGSDWGKTKEPKIHGKPKSLEQGDRLVVLSWTWAFTNR